MLAKSFDNLQKITCQVYGGFARMNKNNEEAFRVLNSVTRKNRQLFV